VIVSTGEQIAVDNLPEPIRAAVGVQRLRSQPRSLAEVEAEYVTEILAGTKGNKTEAARILGISRKNLYEKLARARKDEG
jgi:DNA-binding NtrC family response regulator